MGQNEMIFYIVAAGCMICLMIGIVKKPAYLLVLLLRGALFVCGKESQHQSILISCPLEQVHCWGFQELLRCMRQRCFYCSNNVM